MQNIIFRILKKQQYLSYEFFQFFEGKKGSFLIYSIKFWTARLIKGLTGRQFDYRSNFFVMILSMAFSPLRYFLIKTVTMVDKFAAPSFGAIQSVVTRTIYHRNCYLSMDTSDTGLDLRMFSWKRSALEIIIKLALNHKLNEVRLMEIGSASGIVSLMFAEWANKVAIKFNGICIEPSFSNIDFLSRHISRSSFDIRIIPCAINHHETWTIFEDEGTKGFVGDAVNLKNNTTLKLSMSISDIFKIGNAPNVVYLDAFLNEGPILEEILNLDQRPDYILVELDHGVPEKLVSKCLELKLEIKKVDRVHYIIGEKINENQ